MCPLASAASTSSWERLTAERGPPGHEAQSLRVTLVGFFIEPAKYTWETESLPRSCALPRSCPSHARLRSHSHYEIMLIFSAFLPAVAAGFGSGVGPGDCLGLGCR